jgi:hypothetical protein
MEERLQRLQARSPTTSSPSTARNRPTHAVLIERKGPKARPDDRQVALASSVHLDCGRGAGDMLEVTITAAGPNSHGGRSPAEAA